MYYPQFIFFGCFFLLMSCNSSSTQPLPEIMHTHPIIDIDIQKDTTALAAQALIKDIWETTYGQDSSEQVIKSQWLKFMPDSTKAQKAVELLHKSIANTPYSPKSIEYAYILKLKAYAHHFLQDNYSYMKGLPEAYLQAQKHLEQAIELSAAMPKLQAKWRLEAANLAAPKIYFGYKAPAVAEADLIVEKHLRKAAQYYKTTNNQKEELKILRLFDWYNASQAFNYHQYYQRLVELNSSENGENAVSTALVISKWSKYTLGPYKRDSLDAVQTTEVLAYAQKALTAFKNKDLDNTEIAWANNLLTDLAYYYKYNKKDFDSAVVYSQQSIEFCKKHQKSFGAATKSLAATFIEQKQWDKALAAYEDALNNSPKLAYIDTEHFHFGIGIIHFYQHGQKTALTYWKKNLSNQEIMNGVSGYSWYFVDPAFKKQLKKDVLMLAKALNYDHLISVVEQSWQIP